MANTLAPEESLEEHEKRLKAAQHKVHGVITQHTAEENRVLFRFFEALANEGIRTVKIEKQPNGHVHMTYDLAEAD